MRKVLAALDNTDVCERVAGFAVLLAEVLDAQVDALYVRVDGDEVPRAAAEAAGMEVRTITGPPASALRREANRDDVVAVVLGRSHRPGGEPVGLIALDLLTRLPKPVAVVPRTFAVPRRLGRVLVPLEGTRSMSLAPRRTIQLAADAGVEVVLLHVWAAEDVPAYTDQPQHEAASWGDEFLARYCPCPPEDVVLETRVGEPEDHVVSLARECAADLIALGWAQDLAEGRASVIRAVLERAGLPLLLIPVKSGAGGSGGLAQRQLTPLLHA